VGNREETAIDSNRKSEKGGAAPNEIVEVAAEEFD
jgi:hypothetical protein